LKRAGELGAEFHFPRNEQYALPHTTTREYGDEEDSAAFITPWYYTTLTTDSRKKHHLVMAITLVTATPKNWLPTQGLLARLNNFLARLDNSVAGFCDILNTAHRNTRQIVSINASFDRALAPPQPANDCRLGT
jgi:hypothetical protein